MLDQHRLALRLGDLALQRRREPCARRFEQLSRDRRREDDGAGATLERSAAALLDQLLPHQAPAVEDADAGADALGLREQVRVEEHRPPASPLFAQHAPHQRAAERIEPVGRLVEHQQLRLTEQRERKERALPLSLREPPAGPIDQLAHAQPLQLREPLRHGASQVQPPQPGEPPHQRARRGSRGQVGALWNEADPPPHLGIIGAQSEKAHLALVGLEQPEQEPDERGLASAVGPREPVAFAPRDADRHAAERLAPPAAAPRSQGRGETLPHAPELERRTSQERCGHGRGLLRRCSQIHTPRGGR